MSDSTQGDIIGTYPCYIDKKQGGHTDDSVWPNATFGLSILIAYVFE